MGIIQEVEIIKQKSKQLTKKAGEVAPNAIFRLYEDVFPNLPPNQPNFCDICHRPMAEEGHCCSEECMKKYDEEMVRWKENRNE